MVCSLFASKRKSLHQRDRTRLHKLEPTQRLGGFVHKKTHMRVGEVISGDRVLAFDVVSCDDQPNVRRRLVYFTVDATAALVKSDEALGGRIFPVSFGSRGRLWSSSQQQAILRPKDLIIGTIVVVGQRRWRIVQASADTRRYYAQFGQPLAHAIEETGEMESIRFFGRADDHIVVVDFYPVDSTVELRAGIRGAAKRPVTESSIGPLTLWLGRCKPVCVQDDSYFALSAQFLFRAAQTNTAFELAGIRLHLEGWEPGAEAYRWHSSCQTKCQLAHAGKHNDPWRFNASLTGVVKGGLSPQDVTRRVVVSAHADGTMEAEIDDDGYILLPRMRYATTEPNCAQRPIQLVDLVRSSKFVRFEMPKSRVVLHSLHVGSPADERTRQRLDHANCGDFRGLLGADAVEPELHDLADGIFDVTAAVAVAWAGLGGEDLPRAKAIAELALRLMHAAVDARGLSRQATGSNHKKQGKVMQLLRRLECAIKEKEEVKHKKWHPLSEKTVLAIADAFEEPDDCVDAIAFAALGALNDCITDDAPSALRLGAWLARRVAAFAVTPVTVRRTLLANCQDPRALHCALVDRACHNFLQDVDTSNFDGLCDQIYFADFTAIHDLCKRNKNSEKAGAPIAGKTECADKVIPHAPPDASVVRAQRTFATVFGRSYRHRALRSKLASHVYSRSGQPPDQISHAEFISAIHALLAEGQLDFKRRDLDLLADFAFATGSSSPHIPEITHPGSDKLRLPCEDLLTALLTLENGADKLAALRHDAFCRRLRSGYALPTPLA